MKKDEFLSSLERLLRSLKREERNRFLSYYAEMIEDYMEDGCEEEDAVQRIGSPGEIAQEILSDRETQPARPTPTWMKIGVIVLLILGSPLWGSLVLVAICCALAVVIMVMSAYVIIWCIPFIFGVFSVSSLVLAVVSTVGSVIIMFRDTATGTVQMGVGILLAGIFLVTALLTLELGKRFVGVTKKIQQMACRSVSEKERCQSMNIKSLKSKILLAGIIFMLVGTTVGLIGLGMTGFEPDRLMKWKEGRWYQTVNYTDDNFWIGIRLKDGSFYITSYTAFD